MDVFSFASEIVVPTVKEALSDRGDRRRVYIACIVTYSLIDYIAVAINTDKRRVCDSVRDVCTPEFEVVQGVCNGTKHAGNKWGFPFKPGSDRDVPVLYWDVPDAGWGQARWGVPGLSIQREGKELLLDTCLQTLLLTLCNLHPSQLENVDLSFLDKVVVARASDTKSRSRTT